MTEFKALKDPEVLERIRRAQEAIRSGEMGSREGLTADELGVVIEHLKRVKEMEDHERRDPPRLGVRP